MDAGENRLLSTEPAVIVGFAMLASSIKQFELGRTEFAKPNRGPADECRGRFPNIPRRIFTEGHRGSLHVALIERWLFEAFRRHLQACDGLSLRVM
jgi:hypothetical protein